MPTTATPTELDVTITDQNYLAGRLIGLGRYAAERLNKYDSVASKQIGKLVISAYAVQVIEQELQKNLRQIKRMRWTKVAASIESQMPQWDGTLSRGHAADTMLQLGYNQQLSAMKAPKPARVKPADLEPLAEDELMHYAVIWTGCASYDLPNEIIMEFLIEDYDQAAIDMAMEEHYATLPKSIHNQDLMYLVGNSKDWAKYIASEGKIWPA